MGKIEVGSRIVYADEEGGFNALVSALYDDDGEGEANSVDLVFVDNEGTVKVVEAVPNVHWAKNELEEELEEGETIYNYWRP